MNRRELLQEQYEDALFALLMDEVATEEGRRARQRNMELLEEPEAEVPDAVRERCMRSIRRGLAVQNMRKAGRTAGRVLNRVAVAVFVFVIFGTAAFAASESVRAGVLNFVIDTYDIKMTLNFEDETDAAADVFPYEVYARWLPDGFELTDEGHGEGSIWHRYSCDDSNSSLYISAFLGKDNSLSIDNENTVSDFIEIGGNKGIVNEKDGYMQIAWGLQDLNVSLIIQAKSIEYDVLYKIAENIVVN